MATIKIRRGSGQPTIAGSGLTAYEPAWDIVNNRLFINNGSTAMWIGAAVIQDTTLSGNCAWTIPTQNSVKTYVDNQVSAGAVSSVNGATGAITIGAGTGIAISTSTTARGITVTNIGVTGLTGTVNQITVSGTTGSVTLSLPNTLVAPGSLAITGLLNPTAGICANGGMTLTGLATIFGSIDMKAGITVGGIAVFTSGFNSLASSNFSAGISAQGGMTLTGALLAESITVTQNSTFIKQLTVTERLNALAGISAAGGLTIDSVYTRGNLAVDGSATLLGGFDAKGATFGNLVRFTAGISANGGMTLGGSLQAAAATFSGLVTANSGLVVNGGVTFNGNIYAPNLVTSVDGVTGAVDLLAGTGLSITLPTGAAKGITLANTGVVGITGTANQVTVSATTGSVTLSLPSAITTPGSLTTTSSLLVGTDATITGNLTVNGTTTTVNSTTVTIQDPLIAIGGLTGNAPAGITGDVKDRGIVFQWNTGSAGQTGFFGHDQSTGFFTYIPTGAAVSGDVVTGSPGTINVSGVRNSSGTNSVLTLTGVSASNATITLRGGNLPQMSATDILLGAETTTLFNTAGPSALVFRTDPLDVSLTSSITSTAVTAARTFTLPDISGTVVVANTMGATSGWLLRGTGATTVPTWINPNAAGFTAFTSERINLTSVKDAVNYGLVFALGTAGNQILYGDSTTGVMWRPSTNTLTVGAGLGFFEGIVDGGAF